MVSEVVSTAQQSIIVGPGSGTSRSGVSSSNALSATGPREISMFGKDGFSFWDFLDIINPLQHIPVVSTLYRSLTGDEIDPGSRIIGGTLFGGPIGTAISTVNVLLEQSTGKDLGENVVALVFGEPAANPTGEVASLTNAPAASTRPQDLSVQPSLPARAAFDAGKAGRADYRPASAAVSNADAAGMTGIPIARQSPYALANGGPAIESFYRTKGNAFVPATAPDLEALRAASSMPIPPSTSDKDIPQGPDPMTAATARKSAADAAAPADTSTPASQPSTPMNLENGWVYSAMIRALDKYEATARLHDKDPTPPTVSTVQ